METRNIHLQTTKLQKQKISKEIEIHKIELELLNLVSKIESKILKLKAKIVRDKSSEKQVAIWENKIEILGILSILAAHPSHAVLAQPVLKTKISNNDSWKKSESKFKKSTTEEIYNSVNSLIKEYNIQEKKLQVIKNNLDQEYIKLTSHLPTFNLNFEEYIHNLKSGKKSFNKFDDIFIIDSNEIVENDEEYKSINGYLEYNMFQPVITNDNHVLMIQDEKSNNSVLMIEDEKNKPLLLTYPKK